MLSFDLNLSARLGLVLAFSLISYTLVLSTLSLSENLALIIITLIALGQMMRKLFTRLPRGSSQVYHATYQSFLLAGAVMIFIAQYLEIYQELAFTLGVGLVVLAVSSAVMGQRYFKSLAVYTALIFGCVPLLLLAEQALSFPMRRLSTVIAAHLLDWFGADVSVSGTELISTSYRVSVTSACDGLSLFLNLIWIAWANQLLTARTLGNAWLSWLMILPAVLIANTLRIILLFVATGWFGTDILVSFWHDISGWVAVVIAILLYLQFERSSDFEVFSNARSST